MSVFFTSDLHLGHKFVANTRKFMSVDEHDQHIIDNINEYVDRRDKLFVLGDVAFTREGFHKLAQVNCRNLELIFGNHDNYPVDQYQLYFNKLHGFYKYKNLWLSHCPVHPNELYRTVGNLHGHIHEFGASEGINDPRYYNVNTEFHGFKPVPFTEISEYYTKL